MTAVNHPTHRVGLSGWGGKGYMVIPEAVLRGILLIKIKNRRKRHKNNRR
ncbi:MAG: hypothetical protein AB1606_02795 [Nitrospirota bacterium]